MESITLIKKFINQTFFSSMQHYFWKYKCVLYFHPGLKIKSVTLHNLLTLFRIDRRGGGQKGPPYQFFPCNFYKLGNYPPELSDFLF